jgi:hypothetical protein
MDTCPGVSCVLPRVVCHNGYQTWHREYDDQVVEWLKEHDQATTEEFLSFILGLYIQKESQKMFPDADQLIQMTIEEIK